MAKHDLVLIDNPTIIGIHKKLQEHDDRFDEVDERLDAIDERLNSIEARLDKLETDMADVKIMLQRIQEKLFPLLDKIADM